MEGEEMLTMIKSNILRVRISKRLKREIIVKSGLQAPARPGHSRESKLLEVIKRIQVVAIYQWILLVCNVAMTLSRISVKAW